MTSENAVKPAGVDREVLRSGIKDKYSDVAQTPEMGFHFHTGSHVAQMVGYSEEDYAGLPQPTIDSFAGTGWPFEFGKLNPGETVVDLGSGAGFDSLQAARHVGPTGSVTGIDMTQAMVDKAAQSAKEMGLSNVEFKLGYLEELPFEPESVDVVISNGVINLTPDKVSVMSQVASILRPGGRFQIADIIVHKPVGDGARADIDLWSG